MRGLRQMHGQLPGQCCGARPLSEDDQHKGQRLCVQILSLCLAHRLTEAKSKFTGDIITEKEIWACTTCGACEQECPIFIQYIDKIVDMRRYLLDQGSLPQSLQKPMQQIKKKGNAYGGSKGKRSAWTKDLDGIEVKELGKGESADLLFFVDSCGSFDPRIQEISKSFARILNRTSSDFGILGQDETDSGNEIRRLGEEGLFEQIADEEHRGIPGQGIQGNRGI